MSVTLWDIFIMVSMPIMVLLISNAIMMQKQEDLLEQILKHLKERK